jgi:hypothetical protein
MTNVHVASLFVVRLMDIIAKGEYRRYVAVSRRLFVCTSTMKRYSASGFWMDVHTARGAGTRQASTVCAGLQFH